jgi:pimeloyl-ACP methyl ester carboxylesterase
MPVRRSPRRLSALIVILTVWGCDPLDVETPGTLVPPTAAEDPLLPQLQVRVAGRDRTLHLQTFGDPGNPPLFVLPGGPGTDFRHMLPLQGLAKRYHVVFWSPRGAGLSERVTADELAPESFIEEITAVRAAIAPARRVTLVGHSHGAGLFLRFAAHRPEAVEQLVLLEPGPLTREGRRTYDGGAVAWKDGQDFFWQNEILSSRDHAAADFKAVHLLPLSFRNFTCSGDPPTDYRMWRFGAFQYHTITHGSQAPPAGFDWTEGIEAFDAEILVVAGTCGAASADFQAAYNLPSLPGARLITVPGAGHLTLFTTHAQDLLAALRANLAFRP